MQNNNYWNDSKNRAIKAKEWADKMEKEHPSEIAYSVKNTVMCRKENLNFSLSILPERYSQTAVKLEALDSVSAVFKYTDQNSKTAVLNFASYKQPGGMFLQGSKAQEECLCHESTLYNVLARFEGTYYTVNRERLNRALYQNVALYSPDIYFERNDTSVKCDVITCAAPNFSAASKYCNVSRGENTDVLKSRIKFILYLAATKRVDTLILGAFGSGVFGQEAKEVAEITMDLLKHYDGVFKEVVFAVIDEKSANYQAFNDVIGTTKYVNEYLQDSLVPNDKTAEILSRLLDEMELPTDLYEQVFDLYRRAALLYFGKKRNLTILPELLIAPDEITGTLGQLLNEMDLPTDLYNQVQDLYRRAAKLLE